MTVTQYQSALRLAQTDRDIKRAQLAKIEKVLTDPRLEPLSWLQILLITLVVHRVDGDIPAMRRYFDE